MDMKIGTFFNIDIYVNKLLIGMVLISVIMGNGQRVATIFLVVFIHELAHVIIARMFGLQVKEIELYPFGGAIRIGSLLELNPKHEIIISLAGPIVNIMIAIIYMALDSRLSIYDHEYFIRTNLMLACFNILPALPLDGGRATRAVLSKEVGLKKATQIMANGGIVLSIFLIASGVYGMLNGIFNITIFFIAIFLIYSAIKEKKTAAYIMLKDITNKKDILFKNGSMEIRHIVVVDDTLITEIVKKFTPYRYHYINIIDYKMEKRGSISESQMVEGMLQFGVNITIGNLLARLEGNN